MNPDCIMKTTVALLIAHSIFACHPFFCGQSVAGGTARETSGAQRSWAEWLVGRLRDPVSSLAATVTAASQPIAE